MVDASLGMGPVDDEEETMTTEVNHEAALYTAESMASAIVDPAREADPDAKIIWHGGNAQNLARCYLDLARRQDHVAMPWDPNHIVRKDAIDGLKLEGDSLLVWYRGVSLPLIVQEDAEPHFVALKRALGMAEATL